MSVQKEALASMLMLLAQTIKANSELVFLVTLPPSF